MKIAEVKVQNLEFSKENKISKEELSPKRTKRKRGEK